MARAIRKFGDEVYIPLRYELPDLWSLGFGPKELPTEQWLVLGSLSTSPGQVRCVAVVLGLSWGHRPGDRLALNTEPPMPSSWPSV